LVGNTGNRGKKQINCGQRRDGKTNNAWFYQNKTLARFNIDKPWGGREHSWGGKLIRKGTPKKKDQTQGSRGR